MFDAIATVLAWFYELYHNYAFAIAALTFAIFTLLFPLNLKANRSMMAMQAYQPEMKKIQQQYKDDRQKQQEELLKFYQEHGINPLGGCLPLLIQMPIFLVLFRVISGLTRGDEDGTFDPDYLDQSSELFIDLDGSTEMVSFGVNLARSANEALTSTPLESIPYLGLVAITALISWYQQKQMTYRQKQSNTQMVGPQATLMKIIPFFLPVFSFFVPAALVVYFIVSGLFRIGQQGYIRWSNERRDAEKAATNGKAKGTSGGMGGSGGKGKGNGSSGGRGNGAAADAGAQGDGGDGQNGNGAAKQPHHKSRQSGKRKRKR
ncbi:MAG: YidC/Oxa1 family membrane protein insertase [Actinomycetota bacterium]